MNELAEQIEQYLLTAGGWVSSEDLCRYFGLKDDRPFRQVGDRQGLCSRFAISGNKGFKHVSLATTAEWLRFKHRVRKHGISELVRVRDLDKRRHDTTRRYRARKFERDSGQGVMQLEGSTNA